MRRHHIVRALIGALLLVLLLGAPFALAQTSTSLALAWWTFDGGGGTLSSGSYTLIGTIGQPDAAVALKQGNLTLQGGFWTGMPASPTTSPSRIYMPMIGTSSS
jgi:hypothetical protein